VIRRCVFLGRAAPGGEGAGWTFGWHFADGAVAGDKKDKEEDEE
jgi:hypothetical protein